MEKKIYEKPTVAVTAIETENFCAASGLSDSLNSTTEIKGSDMLSKEHQGFDVWGGDEEE